MSVCLKISREKLYNRDYEPDETIGFDIEEKNNSQDYKNLVITLGTIYLQNKGGQK